jgi:hypothetical protein
MRKFYFVFGSIAALALASAAACTSDTDGSGGSGGGTGGNTGGNTSTGGNTGGTTSNGGGGAGTGGSTSCAGCGDYLTDDTVAVEDLCGFVSIDPMTNALECEADSSCSALGDLQVCTCDPAGCAAECGDNACIGEAESMECLGCVTSTCLDEFNGCSGDVQ